MAHIPSHTQPSAPGQSLAGEPNQARVTKPDRYLPSSRVGASLLCAGILGAGLGLGVSIGAGLDFLNAGGWPFALTTLTRSASAKSARAPEEREIRVDDSELEGYFRPVRDMPLRRRVELKSWGALRTPEESFGESLRGSDVIRGRTPHRLLLFTFDDGPDAVHTPKLLEILDRYGIRAVFFVVGERLDGRDPWYQRHRDIVRRAVQRGHVIGNHSQQHRQLPLLNNHDALAEIERTQALIQEITGQRSLIFRPPGGARSARTDKLLADLGYTQMLWNLGTGDVQVRDPHAVLRTWRQVLDREEREGSAGGIILLHDIHAWSVAAVPLLIGDIAERNCELLARNEELFDIVDDLALFFVAPDQGVSEGMAAALDPTLLEARQAVLREQSARYCARTAKLI